mmetsp:Transcript_10710/g.21530  ORF Transcript_10710/g.21530 Transcript_10710/m.21530 type:complete len:82 (-) Transcript_10710:101-346(-)
MVVEDYREVTRKKKTECSANVEDGYSEIAYADLSERETQTSRFLIQQKQAPSSTDGSTRGVSNKGNFISSQEPYAQEFFGA